MERPTPTPPPSTTTYTSVPPSSLSATSLKQLGLGIGERPFSEIMVKGILNSFVLTLSLIVFLVFLMGSYDFFKNVEENKCEMTWMYEYPQYIKINLENEMDTKYGKYGLYAYAEGKYADLAVRHKFSGIPVLFIPGNAGSHKQVRSFASVALRKYLDSKSPYHFDFFSVDFNEELSGLYGYVLPSQSEYLKAAIARVQSFYPEYHSVVLICHSMGGIVAKGLKEHDEPMSNLIISLSTPHSRPPFIFDPEQDLFYYFLSANWTRGREEFGKDVTLVSVAGGDRDIMVHEGFTKWGKHLDIHTTTTAVPGVWASTDHRCIVWCKQFVLAVVRSLFDLVEYQENGFYAMTKDPQKREKILRYHLLKRSSGKSVHGAHRGSEFGKPPGTGWNELITKNYCTPASRSTTYLMFPMQIIQEQVKGDPENYKIMVLTTNTQAKNWIFGCKSQDIVDHVRYCSVGDNLSPQGEIIPHFRRKRKVIHLSFEEISRYSHLVVRLDPSTVKTCVNLEVYDDEERSTVISAKFDSEGKVFYNLSLPMDAGFLSKLFAWSVTANTGNETCEASHNSLASFSHGKFQVYRYLRNESLITRFSDWNATAGNIQLYLEPSCKYKVQVRLASLETAGQIFRTYCRLLPSFMGSIVLMSFYYQRKAKEWSSFHRVLISNAYNLTILPGFIISLLLAVVPSDWPHMLDGPEYFVILPMFCYLVSFAMVVAVASGAWYLIIVSGNAVHAVFLRMLTTRFARFTNLRMPMPDQVADIALDLTFAKFPVIIAVLLLSLTLTTCGTFGLLAGMCFFIIKLFKMYEDILGDLWRARIRDVSESLGPINFQFSCAMIWFFITAFNMPSLIHWVKSFSHETSPQWDISMYLSLMVLPTIAVLWQENAPNFNESLWRLHRVIFYIMGLAIVIWGTFRLYISGFILVFVLITTAMCQLITSIPLGDVEEEEKPEEENSKAEDEPEQQNHADDSSEVSGSEEEWPIVKDSYKRAFEREKGVVEKLKEDLENTEESEEDDDGEDETENSQIDESQNRTQSLADSVDRANSAEKQEEFQTGSESTQGESLKDADITGKDITQDPLSEDKENSSPED